MEEKGIQTDAHYCSIKTLSHNNVQKDVMTLQFEQGECSYRILKV